MKTIHMVVLSLVAACGGGSANTVSALHPSAAQYEARAVHEEAAANEDNALYDPTARKTFDHCVARRDEAAACWTEDFNPTEGHLKEANDHRKAAAKFRGLSQVMRDVEARECQGLSQHDTDTSPFAHVRDIINIAPLDVETSSALRREGAAFTFRAVPGMRLEWLQQVVRCQLARDDAMGHDVPYLDYCPLVPPNVTATVKQTSVGYVVEVSSGDKASIAEIQRRAALLQQMRLGTR